MERGDTVTFIVVLSLVVSAAIYGMYSVQKDQKEREKRDM
jgi:Na+-transporting NADH:ubiquinone oxidoreductase subunit NqrC